MAVSCAGSVAVTLQSVTNLVSNSGQDPYASLEHGRHTYRSRTAKTGGTNPVWNEIFYFDILDESEAISITIKDSKIIHDEILGHGEISLKNLPSLGEEDQVVKLYSHNNEQRGQVNVHLQYRDRPATKSELRREEMRQEREEQLREGY